MIYDGVNSIADYRVIPYIPRQLTDTFKIAICYNDVDYNILRVSK